MFVPKRLPGVLGLGLLLTLWLLANSSTHLSAAGNDLAATRAATAAAGSSHWVKQATLSASDAAVSDGFGWVVTASGDTVAISAPAGNKNQGAVYVFVHDPATEKWTQQAKLTASDGAANDHFGYGLAIWKDVILVGAPYKNNFTGAVYGYQRDKATGAWTQFGNGPLPGAAQPGDLFGWTIVIQEPVKTAAAAPSAQRIAPDGVGKIASGLTANSTGLAVFIASPGADSDAGRLLYGAFGLDQTPSVFNVSVKDMYKSAGLTKKDFKYFSDGRVQYLSGYAEAEADVAAGKDYVAVTAPGPTLFNFPPQQSVFLFPVDVSTGTFNLSPPLAISVDGQPVCLADFTPPPTNGLSLNYLVIGDSKQAAAYRLDSNPPTKAFNFLSPTGSTIVGCTPLGNTLAVEEHITKTDTTQIQFFDFDASGKPIVTDTVPIGPALTGLDKNAPFSSNLFQFGGITGNESLILIEHNKKINDAIVLFNGG